jgi:hypothetical protein
MNETVATYLALRLIHIHICILKLNKIISKNILISCIYIIFFSYLDIFSLDNDSFDYRNVD